MTTTIDDDVERQIWSSMPGWGIAADLTPPEVVERRRVRSLRKVAVAVLGLAVLVCVAGFALSLLQERESQERLDTAQSQTTALQAQRSQYAEVVQVQAETRAIDVQIGQLMATDVDTARLLTRLRAALPDSMSLTSVDVSTTPATDADAATADADPDAPVTIGTVTLAGTSPRLGDLAGYVSALGDVDGFVDVLPVSNSAVESGRATWSVTVGLTDDLYTHRYDVTTQADGGTP